MADGRTLFNVTDSDGGTLIAWRELPRSFSVEVARHGGMTAGPSDSNREGKTLRAVHAAVPSPPWRESLADMGLTVQESNIGGLSHHIRIMQDGKCAAQWWPNTRTTLDEKQQRGPRCETGEDLVAWLKSM